jgi:tyrosine-protein phosphatase YwqE
LLSSVGYYGNGVAAISDFLLKENYIDFVGSDVHHKKHIDSFSNKLAIKSEKELQEAIYKNSYFK